MNKGIMIIVVMVLALTLAGIAFTAERKPVPDLTTPIPNPTNIYPDLIIERFAAPATATQTENLSQKINVVVKNIGKGKAGDFIVAIVLKGTVVNPDLPTYYHIMGSATVAGLQAGQSVPVSLGDIYATSMVPPKQYEICAIADERKKVKESDEKNNWSNCRWITIVGE